MLSTPNGKLHFRPSDKGGWEWSNDKITWYFTFRTESAIREMHPDLIDDSMDRANDEEREREIFGETLDDPIPEDIWEMLHQLL